MFWDTGWGCVYRCAQTLFGVLKEQKRIAEVPDVQTIGKWCEIELFFKYRVELFKMQADVNLFDLWIEPHNIALILKKKFSIDSIQALVNIPCISLETLGGRFKTPMKIFTQKPNCILRESAFVKDMLKSHFEKEKTPIIVDDGILCFAILSYRSNYIEYADPHFTDKAHIKSVSFSDFFSIPRILLLTLRSV